MKDYTFGFKTFILGRYGSLLIALILLMVMQPAVDTQLGKYLLEIPVSYTHLTAADDVSTV